MLMKKIFLLIILSVLFTDIASAGENKYPQRIISLAPYLTEAIYLLDAQDKLVGVTTYCQKPEEAKLKEKVGTVIEVNTEKIISLNPDLVLATQLTNPKAKEKLSNLGIKVTTFPVAKNFSEVCAQFLDLAKLVCKETEAEQIIKIAEERINSVREMTKNKPKPKVFVQIGANPLFTVTKNDFINNLIELAGGINVASGIDIGFYSRERVLEDNPDIIIITAMEINSGNERRIWQKYTSIKAVQNKQIYISDSYKLCSPTPITFAEALEEMSKILHSPLIKENN